MMTMWLTTYNATSCGVKNNFDALCTRELLCHEELEIKKHLNIQFD